MRFGVALSVWERSFDLLCSRQCYVDAFSIRHPVADVTLTWDK